MMLAAKTSEAKVPDSSLLLQQMLEASSPTSFYDQAINHFTPSFNNNSSMSPSFAFHLSKLAAAGGLSFAPATAPPKMAASDADDLSYCASLDALDSITDLLPLPTDFEVDVSCINNVEHAWESSSSTSSSSASSSLASPPHFDFSRTPEVSNLLSDYGVNDSDWFDNIVTV
jgi:hypothetical protein